MGSTISILGVEMIETPTLSLFFEFTSQVIIGMIMML